MFQKMRVKPSSTAMVLYAPADYPRTEEYHWTELGPADFVHLFVESREQFLARFPQAEAASKEGGLLWVSYPKDRKKTHDINRDSLWSLLLPAGFHPVSQVSLDEEWSAVRVKANEAGVVYEPPANVKLVPYVPDGVEAMRIDGRLQPARADALPASFEPLSASRSIDIDNAIGRTDRDWL